MDESSREWSETHSFSEENSLVIYDSEENDSGNLEKGAIYIVESSENSVNNSRSLTPDGSRRHAKKKLSLTEKATKNRIKKHMPYDSEEDECVDDSNEGIIVCSDEDADNNGVDDSCDWSSSERKYKDKVSREQEIIDSSTSSKSELDCSDSDTTESRTNDSILIEKSNSMEKVDQQESKSSMTSSLKEDDNSMGSEVAISLAKQEIGVGNINPLVAQKRALLVCKMEQLKDQLKKTKLLLTTGNIDLLPDKGEKLHRSIQAQEREIEEIAIELENTPLTENVKVEAYSIKQEVLSYLKDHFLQDDSKFQSDDTLLNLPTKAFLDHKELGRKAQETLDKERMLTIDRLKDMHGSLVGRPTEEERAEDPQGLKVKLMPHQQHALAWMRWREKQKPSGGVLADDMGLGKTLTMISLIIADVAKKQYKSKKDSSDEDEEEQAEHKPTLRHRGGTLVVCPASLLSQWEKEITNRCKRGLLSVEMYHGANRESVPKNLAKNDVVITTYNILGREFKSNSTVYKVHWDRVILDEAHIIRNHKSQVSQAVCGLLAKKRWALTGTPLQNKEMDLFAILKFLKCSPFDDLRLWKRWVDNKNAAGQQRLATVMKTLMLRRTKQELQDKGGMESLPEKFIEEIFVKLDPQEQLVYEKVLIYSRTLFAQFLSQRAEKDHMVDLGAGKYDKASFLSNPNKNTAFTKAQNKLLSLHADVKAHEILVLLLRLRQICVHPSLIHSMLDQEDISDTGLTDAENVDPNLLLQMHNMKLNDANGDEQEKESEEEIGVDHRVATNLLTTKNPVFEEKRASSKMKVVLETVQEILKKNDKVIIVSQWASALNLVASFLPSIKGASYTMFTGSVPIKQRQDIMDSFNAPNSDPRILLLSLNAGGVGLNLVGGNHLLLIDIHWNPQLELQAQDRIYRFGQKKNVFIYRLLCKNTIEERIKHLQDRKLDMAQNILSGHKNSGGSKLTMDDLKSLFAL